MPDLRGRVLQEQDTAHAVGQQIEAGLPNITGTALLNPSVYNASYGCGGASSGSLTNRCGGRRSTHIGYNDGSNSYHYIDFDASASNPVYGNSTTVQPPAYAVRYLIRARP